LTDGIAEVNSIEEHPMKRHSFSVVIRILILGSGLLAVTVGGTPAAAGAPSLQSQLLDLEQTWMHAAEDRDTATLSRVLSDDYLDINYKGMVRAKRDALKSSNVSDRTSTQTLSDEKVRLYGKTAIVTGRGTLTSGHQSYHWRFTDVFVASSGQWRVVSSQETVEAAD
jgi:hypothetical protein